MVGYEGLIVLGCVLAGLECTCGWVGVSGWGMAHGTCNGPQSWGAAVESSCAWLRVESPVGCCTRNRRRQRLWVRQGLASEHAHGTAGSHVVLFPKWHVVRRP